MADVDRGEIILDLPVSYQNLLDGVIKFIMTGQQGQVITAVPHANVQNNDLIISSERGAIEITNVHPGSAIYTNLQLSVDWLTEGSTLLGLNIASGPRLMGVNGFVTWPSLNSVNHDEFSQAVTIIFGNKSIVASAVITDKNGAYDVYSANDGIITIPLSGLGNAIERKVDIELTVNGMIISKIVTLPMQESEDFSLEGSLRRSDGEFIEHVGGPRVTTDFIDIEFVTDIAYAGICTVDSVAAVCAYDNDQNFVKVLLASDDDGTTKHFVPDGTYKFIRACASKNYSKSLVVYYRNRG